MDFDAVNITAVRVAVLLVVSFRQLLKDALIYIYILTVMIFQVLDKRGRT